MLLKSLFIRKHSLSKGKTLKLASVCVSVARHYTEMRNLTPMRTEHVYIQQRWLWYGLKVTRWG